MITLSDITEYISNATAKDLNAIHIAAMRKARSQMGQEERVEKAIEHAFSAVFLEFGYTKAELLSYARPDPNVHARQCLYYLLREQGIKTVQIGIVCNRGHSSICHGQRAYLDRITTDHKAKERWWRTYSRFQELNR